ncbi:MAG: tetratricopeptide repeat protein [Bythopirellula sp.]
MRKTTLFSLVIAVCVAVTLKAKLRDAESEDLPYYDLGGFHYQVTTTSKAAQSWFDRGLAMCYGFNHEEAVRCFEKALAADPGMPMALWGIAYAWGPNINNMLIEPAQITKAEQTIQLARQQATNASDLERKLIDALAARYTTPVPENRDPLNEAYTDALRKIYQDHGDDPLVVSLYAESLMNLQPWLHWSADGKPGPHTPEIRQVLETGLQRWPDYPSLCHLYIHAMEASPTPELALPSANHLRDAMPGQGHLVHMPTHIDIWLGDYAKVIDYNRKAIVADEEFLRREGPANFYSLYRIHNYHFLVYGAMFDGQSELALETARAIKSQVPESMIREQVDFLDAFMPTDLHVLVRFGRWEEILEQPQPADYLLMSRAVWHYTRALAYAATNRVDQAEVEQDAFDEAMERVPETSFLFQNPSLSILGVAESMVAGEIAYRRGEFDEAFKHLREAVRRDDGLNYDEPWGWMQPARHALGALLLEQQRVAEAETVYREDLRRHPNNPWALHGLAECLEKQGKTKESAQCRAQFTTAAERTDVTITRSCFCRLSEAD